MCRVLARQIIIMQANGKCQRCGGIGQEVHHIKRLNVDNVNDVSISINPENLELLCKEYHNKEHKRFCSRLEFDKEGNLINK